MVPTSCPRNYARRALYAALVLSVAGCAEPHVAMSEGVREYTATDYATVLKRWTREAKLTDLGNLDVPLMVTATFESWDFRWAYVVRYAEDYRLTVEQRRQLLDKTLAETRTLHSFYVALAGSKWRWSDLSKPGSAWVVRLIDETGNETAPSSIDPILRPGAIEMRYFPYTTPWRHTFRVSFPVTRADGRLTIDPRAKWFGLRFAGAEGHDELRWEIEGDSAAKVATSHPPKNLE